MTVLSVKPTGNLRLDLSRSIIPPSTLQALFLLQETILRDSSGSLASGGVNAGIAATAPFAQDSPGLVMTFDGSHQDRVIYNNLPGASDADWTKWCVLGRFKPTAAPASTPGQIFGLGNSSGTQSSFGIGTDTSNNVGGTTLTGNAAAIGAKSAGSLNTWYTVYTQGGANNTLNNAWINGAPATTQAVLIGGGVAAFTEVDFGAQHRSAGYLRNAKGNLEWGAILYGITMTDGLAQALYNADWPYCMLVPAIRPGRTRRFVSASGTSASVNLTGVAGTGAVGAFTPQIGPTFSGVAGTAAVGAFTPQVAPAFSGVAGTGAVGSFVPEGDITFAGVSGTGAVGAFVPQLDVPFAGVAASGAAGSFLLSVTTSVYLAGVFGTGAAGSFAFGASAGAPEVHEILHRNPPGSPGTSIHYN